MSATVRRLFGPTGLVGHRGLTILHTGAWALVAKACAAANLFISVSMALSALGPQRFGAWATLVSLVTFAGFLDFGFGNGTMNLIAAARTRGDQSEITAILNQGGRTLVRVAFGLAIPLTIALPLVPWYRLLGLPSIMASESWAASAIVLGSVVLSVPLNLATRVQLGLGRGDRAFRWQATGQLVGLGIVVVVAELCASLPALTAAAVSAPLLGAAANTFQLRRDRMRYTDEHRGSERPDLGRTIRREGMMFFILQLAAALAYSTDLPLISMLRGASEAGTYAIVQRLFSIIPLGLSLVWTPLWPIYRHALASGSQSWVRSTLRRSAIAATLTAGLLGVVLAGGFHTITSLWVHGPIAASGWLLAGFFAWSSIDALGTSIATFLNAASIMRYQVVVAIIFAVLCVSAKAWVVVFAGAAFVPWVTAGVYAIISLIPTLALLPKLINTALGKSY